MATVAELLDKEFVVQSMDWVREGARREAYLMKHGDPEALKRGEEAEASPGDLDQAEQEVGDARDKEAETLSGAGGSSQEPYFPPMPVAGLTQSALHRFFVKEDLIQEPQGQGLAPSDIAVTDRSLRPGALFGQTKKLFGAFSQTDAGWVSCKIAQGINWFRKPQPFSDTPARLRIGDNARVILVADWATAIPRARLIGQRMREQLLHPDAAGKEKHVIHLGDVYYSGWSNEYDDNFLHDWPVHAGEESRARSWCLNANHDMFGGGHAYFGHLLKQPRFDQQNGCSYFCLENKHWQIFGLDTAYSEYDLHGNQAEWVKKLRAERPDSKAVMLSHHQLFSLYGEKESPKVEDKLKSVLETDRVRAWFWGHEHRCAIYQRRHYIQSPRLIGHGGVPVWAPRKPKPLGVEFEYSAFLESGLEQFQRFGFAVLDFDDDKIGVRHIGEDGEPYWTETLS